MSEIFSFLFILLVPPPLFSSSGPEPKAVLKGHLAPVVSVSFSPDGASLATIAQDRSWRLWNVSAGVSGSAITAHNGPGACVAYAPDGAAVATAGEDATLRVWSVATGQSRASVELGANAVSAAFSPDSLRVAAGLGNGVIKIWEIGGPAKAMIGHSGPVVHLSYSSDGRELVSGSLDGSVRIWNLDAGKERVVFSGLPKGIKALAVSPGGNTVALGLPDKRIALWSLESGRETAVLMGHADIVDCLAFSPDGRLLASGAKDQSARLWDLAGGVSAVLKGHGDWIAALAFSRDGSMLATGSWDKTIRLWDVAQAFAAPVPAEVSAASAPAAAPVPVAAPVPAPSPQGRRFPWELLVGGVCAAGLAAIVWARRSKPPPPPPPARIAEIVLSPVQSDEPGAGRKLVLGGRFEALHRLGMGAVGAHYEGLDRIGGGPVLIKKLRDDLRLDAAGRRAFLAAAAPAVGLRHPGISGVEAVLEEAQSLYLVCAAPTGAFLSDTLETRQRLGYRECRVFLMDLCPALAHAHAAGVSHGNITPASVILDGRGGARWADFVVSRLVREAALRASLPDDPRGPAYRAPEDSGGPAPSGDLYSLGIVLYQALTGVPPFPGPNFAAQKREMIYAHPAQIVRDLPQGLGDFFRKAVAPEPGRRFKNAEEFLAAF